MRNTFLNCLLLTLLLSGSLLAQGNLRDLLSGTDAVPASLKARDLTGEWRMVRLETQAQSQMQALWRRQVFHQETSPWEDIYYTRGQQVQMGGEEYLIAYRPRANVEENQLRRRDQRVAAVRPENAAARLKLPEDTELSLSLLHIKDVGSMHNIRVFDPQNDLLTAAEIEREEKRAAAALSTNNLRQIGLALLQYTQDYDEKLPIMRAAKTEAEVQNVRDYEPAKATVQQVLAPYTRNTEIFLHPVTRRPYLPNPTLSGRDLNSIQQEPSRVVTFYEDAFDDEGKRAVAFLDGHVRRVDKTTWERLRKSSHIPP